MELSHSILLDSLPRKREWGGIHSALHLWCSQILSKRKQSYSSEQNQSLENISLIYRALGESFVAYAAQEKCISKRGAGQQLPSEVPTAAPPSELVSPWWQVGRCWGFSITSCRWFCRIWSKSLWTLCAKICFQPIFFHEWIHFCERCPDSGVELEWDSRIHLN